MSLVQAGAASTATGFVDGGGTGAIFGGPLSPIRLFCDIRTASVKLPEVDMTATRVSAVNGATVKGKPAHPRISNHFKPQLGLPAARYARSQTHH